MTTTLDQDARQVLCAREGTSRQRQALALEADLCIEAQRILAADPDVTVVMSVARHPKLAAEVQLLLARHDKTLVRDYLTTTTLIAEVQLLLARDSENEVRGGLGMSQVLTTEVQEILLKDMAFVREGLAYGPGLAPHVLATLAADSDTDVRRAVARRDDLTRRDQELLARDPAASVRAALAGNTTLLPDLQTALAGDPEREVHTALAGNSALVLSDDMPVDFYQWGAIPRAFLRSRLAATDPSVRTALAPGFAGTLKELLAALESFK